MHFQEHLDNATFPKSISSESSTNGYTSSEYEDSEVQKYCNEPERPYDDSIASPKSPALLKQSIQMAKRMKLSSVPESDQVYKS